ncbi:HAD family hydrolase [Actinokineospora auranticolor]|uniref:Phosphoglycolate phosphatase-like HAD superfamily hydrolase n=1 Tax=Actinokineospora auranticolor TaxID=155976 RepID=A0A2S6GK99_9PSEU|nr:HAD family hydrolase [Actinokineospora auranticolor]PPK65581.1 phosphoglycolate phosphatase-like HAD superfamily hydrolase [Actinokineospora auranticolor]
MRVDHIVWDWNGTLLDDGDAMVRATIAAFARAGLPAITLAGYQEHFTRPIPDFYDRLAGKVLTAREQGDVAAHFHHAYADLLDRAALHSLAVAALTAWRDAGRTQSLLSMFPHDRLVALPQFAAVAGFFDRVDGMRSDESPRKEPHLRGHLRELGERSVLVVGDSVDDVAAAEACGVPALLYHPVDQPLVSPARLADLGAPVVNSLPAAVDWALGAR